MLADREPPGELEASRRAEGKAFSRRRTLVFAVGLTALVALTAFLAHAGGGLLSYLPAAVMLFVPLWLPLEPDRRPRRLGAQDAWSLGEGVVLAAGLALGGALLWPLLAQVFAVKLVPWAAAEVSLEYKVGLVEYAVFQVLGVAFPEEWFFRGYVQRALCRSFGTPGGDPRPLGFGRALPALLVATALFAVPHLFARGFHPVELRVFLPGLLFALLYFRRESIAGGVFLHAACNVFWAFVTRV